MKSCWYDEVTLPFSSDSRAINFTPEACHFCTHMNRMLYWRPGYAVILHIISGFHQIVYWVLQQNCRQYRASEWWSLIGSSTRALKWWDDIYNDRAPYRETCLSCNPFNKQELHITHWGWDKIVPILQTTFSNTFSWMKIMYFDWNFTKVCSQGSN